MIEMFRKIKNLIESGYAIYYIIAFCFLIRIVYVFWATDYSNYFHNDMAIYWNRAWDRFNGNIIDVHQWTVWPPFYSYILALLFEVLDFVGLLKYRLEIVLMMNIILSCITLYYLYEISQKISRNKYISIAIVLTYGLSYPMIYLNAFVMTENISVPLVIISIALLFQKKLYCRMISGVFLAVAIAARPVFVLFIFPCLIYLFYSDKNMRRKWVHLFSYGMMFCSIITGVLIENYHVSRGKLFGLSSSGGVLFYLNHSKEQLYKVECNWDGINYWIGPPSVMYHPENGTRVFNGISVNDQHYFYSLAWKDIRDNPYIWIYKIKKLRQLIDGVFWPYEDTAVGYTPLMSFSKVAYSFFCAGSIPIYLLLYGNKSNKKKLLLLLSLILCSLIIFYFYNVEQRYLYGFSFVLHITYFLVFQKIILCWEKYKYHLIAIYGLLMLLTLGTIIAKIYSINTMSKNIKMEITKIETDNMPIKNSTNTETRYINEINFPWGERFTHNTFGKFECQEYFCVEFITTMDVAKAGDYEFIVYPDDAFKLLIDNKAIIQQQTYDDFKEKKASMYLGQGKHHLKMSYFQAWGRSGLLAYYRYNAHSADKYFIGFDNPNVHFLLPESVEDKQKKETDSPIALAQSQVLFMMQGWGKCQENKTVDGNVFSVSGRKYDVPGLGTHAPSIIIYDISSFGDCILKTKFGRDDETKDLQGKVQVNIYVDGKRCYQSPLLSSKDEPVTISLPIKGNKLIFHVTDGLDSNNCDHVDWLEPVLIKQKNSVPNLIYD